MRPNIYIFMPLWGAEVGYSSCFHLAVSFIMDWGTFYCLSIFGLSCPDFLPIIAYGLLWTCCYHFLLWLFKYDLDFVLFLEFVCHPELLEKWGINVLNMIIVAHSQISICFPP